MPDLKPENILLKSKEDDTQVKVADFGVAKTLGNNGLKTFCGSPQYFGAYNGILWQPCATGSPFVLHP